MKITLIRHFKSEANRDRYYSGTSDIDIIRPIKVELIYPEGDIIYSSSLKRAVKSVEFIYPNREINKIDEFNELDFGDWTGKKFDDLKDNKTYRTWIDSPTVVDIPGGESYRDFSHRVLSKLNSLLDEEIEHSVIVTHGGVISCILSELILDEIDFYKHIPENGHYVTLEFEGKKLININKSEAIK